MLILTKKELSERHEDSLEIISDKNVKMENVNLKQRQQEIRENREIGGEVMNEIKTRREINHINN